jgi:prevent-host-death family protein
MERATISEIKNHLSAYLKRVVAGNPILVLDRGRPIAKIEKVDSVENGDERIDRLERAGLLRRGSGQACLPQIVRAEPAESFGVVEALLAERREGR